MNARNVVLSGLALALGLGGCKREQRSFRVDPPLAERINSLSLVSLAPGGKSPPPAAKNEYEELIETGSETG